MKELLDDRNYCEWLLSQEWMYDTRMNQVKRMIQTRWYCKMCMDESIHNTLEGDMIVICPSCRWKWSR
jgi:hypothetical protein